MCCTAACHSGNIALIFCLVATLKHLKLRDGFEVVYAYLFIINRWPDNLLYPFTTLVCGACCCLLHRGQLFMTKLAQEASPAEMLSCYSNWQQIIHKFRPEHHLAHPARHSIWIKLSERAILDAAQCTHHSKLPDVPAPTGIAMKND